MTLFDSHGEAPHPLQQQLIFDTSQARQEVKDFADATVKSLREAEAEARKLGAELENLVQARLKFNGDKNRQRVQVVDPAGDARFFTRVKLEENIKKLNQEYQKTLKLAQDLAREESDIARTIEAARKANHLFAQDLEKNPQNIAKVKNAYADLERQIDRISKLQVKSPTQSKYLDDLKNAYKLNSDQIEHLIDLEHRHAREIQNSIDLERKRTAEARNAYESEKKAAEVAERNAQALRAIQTNPTIRPDKAFNSDPERALRESALRAAFNSKEFQQQQIRLNIQDSIAASQKARASSGFNVNDLEKQVEKNVRLREKEAAATEALAKKQADAASKAADRVAKATIKAANDASKAEQKAAVETSKAVEKARKQEEKAAIAAAKASEKAANEAATLSRKLADKASTDAQRSAKATEKAFIDVQKAKEKAARDAAKVEESLEKQRYDQAVKDRIALEAADAASRKRQLAQLKSDIQARSRAEQDAAKTQSKAQQTVQNRPAVLDKEIGALTVQYLRAQKAAEALSKANKGIGSKEIKDAKTAVEGYRQKLGAALNEAKALGSQTGNMARAQAALSGAFDKSRSALGKFIDITSKVGFALFGLQTALYAILAPINAINQAFVQTNVRLEEAQLAIAATFQNNFIESFATSMKRAEDLVVKIRAEAVKTNLTFEELQQAVSSNLSGLFARGATPDQALELISRISQAAKTQLGPRFDPSRVNDEIRALLNKQITGRTNETLLNLGITKADLKPLKDVSDLLDLIRKKTIGQDEANKVFGRTFQGVLDKLKDRLLEIDSISGKPLFAELTRSLNEFSDELAKGTFDGLLASLRDVGFLLADIVKGFTTLSKIGTIDIGFNVKLGEIVGPLANAGTGFALGRAFLGRFGGGPAGAAVTSLISAGLEQRKVDRINERRQAFDKDPESFLETASVEDLQAQLQDLTVRKFRQIDQLKKDNSNTAPAFQEAVQIGQENLKKTLADMKALERAITSRFSSNPSGVNSKRRFGVIGLGSGADGKTKLPPKSIVEGLPKLSEIEQISKGYTESIRSIESANKELQASLDAIDPGGLVGIAQEIQTIRDKIALNSTTRDTVLGIVTELSDKKGSLASQFESARATVLANPKDKQATQRALILKDQFTQAQRDLEKAIEEQSRLEAQFGDLQADLSQKQREQLEVTRQQRIELGGLNADITELQNTLESNAVEQAFAKLATAARRSNPEIKNLREEIDELEKSLTGVTGIGNGRIPIDQSGIADPEQQARAERLRFARLQLAKAEKSQAVEFGAITLEGAQTLQSRTQQVTDRLSINPRLTQQQRDSISLVVNDEARASIERILATGLVGAKDIRQNGVLPPEIKTQLETLRDQFEATTLQIRQAYTVNVVDAGKQAFDSFFDSILDGTANFTQAFLGFFKDIATQMERILSSNVADKLNQILFKGKNGFPFLAPQSAPIPALASAATTTGSILNSTGSLLPTLPGPFGSALNGGPASVRQNIQQGVVGAYDEMLKPGGLLGQTASAVPATPMASAGAGSTFASKALGILIPIGGAIGSFQAGRAAGQQYGKGKGVLAGLGAGALIGGIAGSVLGPVGTILGASVGGTLGGIGGLFGGSGSSARQAQRAEYQNNVLSPYLNKLVNGADPNNLSDLQKRVVQASRGMKANGSAGQALKRDAMDKLKDMIKDLQKRVSEALDALNEQIEEFARPLTQRGIVPEIVKTLADLKEQLKMGVNPDRIFEAFNLTIRDQLTTMQQQLDDTVTQINQGAEDDQGNLISLAKGLSNQIEKIQKDAQDDLENIREGFASQASSIIGEGRASAITPSAESRQQRLAILGQQQRKDETDLQTNTTNSILRATNETNREIADLQKSANTTLEQISLLLSTAISQAPGSLGSAFNTGFLQDLQKFVNTFNPFQALSLVPALDGGLGINIDKLVLPAGMDATSIGQMILDAIAQAEQNRQYSRTAQQA